MLGLDIPNTELAEVKSSKSRSYMTGEDWVIGGGGLWLLALDRVQLWLDVTVSSVVRLTFFYLFWTHHCPPPISLSWTWWYMVTTRFYNYSSLYAGLSLRLLQKHHIIQFAAPRPIRCGHPIFSLYLNSCMCWLLVSKPNSKCCLKPQRNHLPPSILYSSHVVCWWYLTQSHSAILNKGKSFFRSATAQSV